MADEGSIQLFLQTEIESEYQAFVDDWHDMAAVRLTPIDNLPDFLQQHAETEEIYSVYEGSGIIRFATVDGQYSFKCHAKEAVSPFCQLQLANLGIDDYCDDEDWDYSVPLDLSEELKAFNEGRNAA
ncbi:hypothetical protein BGZ83_010606 [Gryganskiella cystojenkinii]|nr:hypothetical protein BGZ83_010606 [Gryganskiella cystojenkinii]